MPTDQAVWSHIKEGSNFHNVLFQASATIHVPEICALLGYYEA